MGWLSKVKALETVVKEEKKKSTTSIGTCIHGETGCGRCSANELEGNYDNVWIDLEEDDVRRVVVALPKNVREVLRKNPGQAVIAGGFIRAIVAQEVPADIDLFMKDRNKAYSLCNEEGIKLVEGDKCWHGKGDLLPLQAVWRYEFKEAYQILQQFDYTVCKAAIYFDNGDKNNKPGYLGICHKRFYSDIARKYLVYDSDRGEEYLNTIPRLLKYTARGYIIEPKSLAKVITKTCLSLDLTNGFEGIEEQLLKAYQPMGTDDEWKKLTEKYVKPTPRREPTYSSGS